jgi:sulfate permease, SulP family
VQSVPDGLASGLLAGVNPLAGLNAYMVGTITGAFFTSAGLQQDRDRPEAAAKP